MELYELLLIESAATGAFPAFPAAAAAATGTAPGPMHRLTGELTKLTGELTRITGALPQLSGAPDRPESGLATLFAVTSAAVVSDGNTLNVATQIWRTGGFPQLPAEATRPPKPTFTAATSRDLYAGRAAPTVQTPVQRAAYQRRQQDGIDALLSIATPLFPSADTRAVPVLLAEDAQVLLGEVTQAAPVLQAEDNQAVPVPPAEDAQATQVPAGEETRAATVLPAEDPQPAPVLPPEDTEEEPADDGDEVHSEDPAVAGSD